MISPIENNGMIARTQDYASYRNQEDIKLAGSQVQVREQVEEQNVEHVRTVHQSDDSDKSDTHHDAREEGRNKYFDIRKGRKDEKPETDGKVIVKKNANFDLRI